MTHKGLGGKVIGAFQWAVIDLAVGRLLSFVVFLILARLLLPEDFGLIAIASLLGDFARPVIDQGLSMALIQRDEIDEEHKNGALIVSLIIGVGMCLIGFLLAEPCGRFFAYFNELSKQKSRPVDFSVLAQLIRWFSVSLLLSSLAGVPTALLKRKFQFKSLAIRNLVANVVGGIVGVWMALAGCGVWSMVGQRLSASIVGLVVLYFRCGWKPSFKTTFGHVRQLLSFGISLTGKSVITFINLRGDVILIGMFLGPLALGYYFVATQMYRQAVQLFTNTMSDVTLPAFSKLQNDPVRLVQAFFKSTQYSALITFPVLFGIFVVGTEFTLLTVGEKYLASIPVLRLLVFAGMNQSLIAIQQSLVVSMGKPHRGLIFTLIRFVLTLILFGVTVQWGIVAVAGGLVARSVLTFPVSHWFAKSVLDFDGRRYFGLLLPPLAACAVMSVIVMSVNYFLLDRLHLAAQLAIMSLLGSAIYIVCLRLFSPALFKDFTSLVRRALPPARKAKSRSV